MFYIRKASIVAAATILFAGIISNSVLASKGAVVSTKVSVPANIVKGSALTKNRAFFRTNIPEDTLAGIRLGREAKEILAKWGNPSRITVGTTRAEGPEGDASLQGPAYTPPMSPFAGMAPGINQAAGMLGMAPPMPGMPGMPGLPSLPGYPTPGTAPAPGTESSGGASAVLAAEEVTWTYDLQDGITLEFIITDGLITQITAGGTGPWGLSKTRTGLQLGDTYKLALWVCGYPESQKYVGRFLRVSYVNKNRALFTFLNNKLVGVTIAMVPTEITL